jgi:hypothetical protein
MSETSNKTVSSNKILKNVTSTGAGSSYHLWGSKHTFQLFGTTSAGSGSAIVNVEVSNNNSNWEVAGTITLTLGTSSTSDGFAKNAAWRWVRGNVTTLSGTNATVSLIVGGQEPAGLEELSE